MEKQDIINLYNSILDTNKSFMELANISKRAWAKQDKINKRTLVLIITGIVYIVMSERKHKEQDEKINNLVKEIKELKESKGE